MNKNKYLSINEAFNIALANHKKNRLREAQILYNNILKIKPDYSQVHNNLGVIFAQLGEDQKAKLSYEKAIEINPNYANAHNNLGSIFQNKKILKKQ